MKIQKKIHGWCYNKIFDGSSEQIDLHLQDS